MKFVLPFLAFLIANVSQADIVRFYQVTPKIYRGGQPETEADYQFLKKLKVKTIVNLRADGQSEQSIANRHGFEWAWFPMLAYRTPTDATIDGALAAINNPALQPVFVHCLAGKDRTGLVIALHRVLFQNWSAYDAYYEMRSFGFNRIFLPLLYVFYKRVTGIPPSFLQEIRPVSELHNLNLQAAPVVVGN